MKTCKYCGASGEDGDIARHEPICQYVIAMGPVEIIGEVLETETTIEEQEFICSKCGRVLKSNSGLATHEKACKGA